jgi:hypothetical protein
MSIETLLAILSAMFNLKFPIDQDIVLAAFQLHGRLTIKKKEIERLRKDHELQANLIFPHFMNLSTRRELFTLTENDKRDWAGNYGVQLDVLIHARLVVSELADLRLELPGE